jgi:hypothetical protein
MHGLILNLDRNAGENTFTKMKNTWVPRGEHQVSAAVKLR